jgi:phage gp29-like protein
MVELVDLNGMPLRRAVLTEAIAGPSITGVRSILSGHPAQNITPQRMTSILRNAEQANARAYYELAEEMEEKDPHYLSVLGTRKRAVAQLPRTVEPADDSAEAKADAKFIEDWLDRETLETELFDILDAVGKGTSHCEIIWDQGEQWLPDKLIWRQPSWFEYDQTDGETPMLRGEGGALEPLPFGKFISHVHSAKSGIPVRGGLARAVAWLWMFKNYSIKDWLSFLEMYGQPMRVGRYDVGAHEDDIRKLQFAVSQIGTDAAATYPRTMDIEFIDAKGATAPADLWQAMILFINDEISKAVLGQTSSADAKASGIGSGQSDLHGEVRDDIARADGKLLAATLNRDLVKPMIFLNFGARKKYPRIKIAKPDPVDVKSKVEAATALATLGVEIDAEEMREMAGLPAPKTKGAKLLIAPGFSGGFSGSFDAGQNRSQNGVESDLAANPRAGAPPNLLQPLRGQKDGNQSGDKAVASAIARQGQSDPDAIDVVTDEALGDWDEMFDALATPVAEMIGAAPSLEDARTALASMIGDMDIAKFALMLERAGFAAHLAGEVDLADEQAAFASEDG